MVRFRRRGGRILKSKPRNPPEFFKVYLPEQNSQKLLIPPPFLKNFKGGIPETIILKSPHGKIWNIELEKTENCRFFMKEGWGSYVNDNSLQFGEFMVFRYDGNRTFTVKVFGINGCKRKIEIAEIDNQATATELEATPEQALSPPNSKVEQASQGTVAVSGLIAEPRNIRFEKVDNGKKRCEILIPGWIIKKYNISPPEQRFPEQILLSNKNIGLLKTAQIKQRHDHRVVISRGWRDFYMKHKLRKEDKYELEVVIDKGRKIKELIMVNTPRRLDLRPRKR